ncbi:Lipase esterase family protein [Pleurostoma richardsiae]|uniref:Lipase esterase family protein n=1 Tax=Pleurostoma richardsiae TaxID=41990 RepID=A0AA38VQJ4_9PEZI|nr:Lipase esterase family protein [Pleurostoma richardsiae]
MSSIAGIKQGRFTHLTTMDPEWAEIAPKHAPIDELANKLYRLPIEEFRKVPYKAPPLPGDAPVAGRDLLIRTTEVAVKDGYKVGIRIYEPIQLGKGHVLFFNVHGGGWTVGTPETEEVQNRLVAVKNRAVVVSVDYRRAPEFPFPYALNDSLDVLLWCKENAESLGVDPNKIIVGGGSAGANVSTVLAHIARDEGISGIIGQVLNIPVTCHPDHFPLSKYEYESYEQNAHSPLVTAERMRLFWNNYLPRAEADPRASPLLATSLAGLPPALVQVAGMDPLRDEGLAYTEALRADGVDVTLKVYPGMPHAFYVYPELKSSVEYFQAIVDWIDRTTRDAPTAE